MSLRARLSALALVAALGLLLVAQPAAARRIDTRTVPVAKGNGSSTRPTVSGDGRRIAFDSTASNLTNDPNGKTNDVFLRDLRTGDTQLVSIRLSGVGADGPSLDATISGRGSIVAFTSFATNIVDGDVNGYPDVFLRPIYEGPRLVSRGIAGTPANGGSAQADISQKGTKVVFTSAATNLTTDLDTNGQTDVYVRNMVTGTTRLVSRGIGGAPANGASATPSISPDGRFVSFSSTASNLVKNDTNGVGDVFIADLKLNLIGRASVNSRGRQQNQAVAAPFQQVSDVGRGGGVVVFDSDATNLVRHDRNKDTDVFLHNFGTGKTYRVSLGNGTYAEGDNDSFSPRVTPDGRFVAFESFAGNFYPRDADGEDVYVRDIRRNATSLMSVGADNRPRGREHVRQLLQRPSLSDDARVVALTSTSPLGRRERGTDEDAYARFTAPPRARIHVKGAALRLGADDPVANVFRCRILNRRGLRGQCPRRANLGAFIGQRLVLRVRAMGPGTLLGPPARKAFRVKP
jgi:Tol biopolymer transport system component